VFKSTFSKAISELWGLVSTGKTQH